MAFFSYPTADDVEALLKSSGYWPTDAGKQDFARLQAQSGAEAAADEWKRSTGWNPFLIGSTAPSERSFWSVDARGFLDFAGGAVSVESVSLGGNLIGGYRFEPENAASRGLAITGIQLGVRYGVSFAQPVVVNAVWGRVSQIPGDVWQAIQQKAALIALTQVENLQSIASISEDGFSKAYDVVGIVTQKDLVGIWGKDFDKIAGRWMRVVS